METATVKDYHLQETLVKIDNVSLTLGGRLILKEINGEIKNIIRPGYNQGQIVGLLGPSGIGKTQLFRMLAGLQKSTVGSVLVKEKPVKRGMVGVVDQKYTLFEHRTVLGNLIIAAGQTSHLKSEAKNRAISMLERFKLADYVNFYPAQLSGGQRQRVAIAQQLLCSEHFLLMDEPFSGLDVIMLNEVCELLSEVAGANELNTIIVITHDINAAVTIADTLWLLGRERDEKGDVISGAKIIETYNLIDLGLAWRKDIALTPQFSDFVRGVKEKFKYL